MEEAIDESERLVSLSNLMPDGQADDDRGDEAMEDGGSEEYAEDQGRESDEEQTAEDKREVEEEDDDAVGGLIQRLISSLPVSIPDDATPEADEASLLISIARD